MRIASYVIATAVVAAFSGTATAQTTSAPPPAPTNPTYSGPTESHWVASGFIGSTFNTSSDSAALDSNDGLVGFGGEIGYLWRGVLGGEFLADFAPSSGFDNALITPDRNINVNSYMANVIGTYPLGAEGQFQPYASGGWGRVSASADVFNILGDPNSGTDRVSHGRFGTNIGAGLMAFASPNIGIRTDVRWYRASDNNEVDLTDPLGDELGDAVFSGLRFWRANVGMALRW
jgi:hypothetical protein